MVGSQTHPPSIGRATLTNSICLRSRANAPWRPAHANKRHKAGARTIRVNPVFHCKGDDALLFLTVEDRDSALLSENVHQASRHMPAQKSMPRHEHMEVSKPMATRLTHKLQHPRVEPHPPGLLSRGCN